MAAGTKISLEEYFHTRFEGECELVDGELRPKPMGTDDHSRIQGRIFSSLMRREQAGRGEARVELSLRLGEIVLIPDIVFLRAGQQPDQYRVYDTPPLLCVEVLSPSQGFGELYNKCLRYLHWGVQHCWIIDPLKRLAWQIDSDEYPHELPADGSLRAGEMEVKLSELW